MNQLPVSADRLLQGSQICFEIFILWKITKLLIARQLLKLEIKIGKDMKSYGFYIFLDVCLAKLKNIKI
jgi:hypothetical protein